MFEIHIFRALPSSDKYCYNIKDKLGEYGKPPPKKPVFSVPRHKNKAVQKSKSYVDLKYPKPVYSPRFRPKGKGEKIAETDELKKTLNGVYPKINITDSDYTETSEDDEDHQNKSKSSLSLWKKVSKNLEDKQRQKVKVS